MPALAIIDGALKVLMNTVTESAAPNKHQIREREQEFRILGLKDRCPVCAKKIGNHCPRRLRVCYETYLRHGGPRPYRKWTL